MLMNSLMRIFRAELVASKTLYESDRCNIPYDNNHDMGLWFEGMVAILVLLPIPLAIADTVADIVAPEVLAWREACASDPTFPPSFWQFLVLGQTSSVPGDERLTPALPHESREQLNAVQEMCANDATELWRALAGLEAASRHFVAVLHAPGKLEAVGELYESEGKGEEPWAVEQRRLRTASEAFVAVLLEFVLKLSEGDWETLHPHAMLKATFEALETLYPEVAAQRQEQLARIARSAACDLLCKLV